MVKVNVKVKFKGKSTGNGKGKGRDKRNGKVTISGRKVTETIMITVTVMVG